MAKISTVNFLMTFSAVRSNYNLPYFDHVKLKAFLLSFSVFIAYITDISHYY